MTCIFFSSMESYAQPFLVKLYPMFFPEIELYDKHFSCRLKQKLLYVLFYPKTQKKSQLRNPIN